MVEDICESNTLLDAYFDQYNISKEWIKLCRSNVSHWIDGKAIAEGDPIVIYEPSTGCALSQTYEATHEIVDQAVQSALNAFQNAEWSEMTPLKRQGLILKLADLVEKHADELAFLESVNVGKSKVLAKEVDVDGAINCLRYFAGWTGKVDGRVAQPAALPSNFFAMTLKEPVGVVAVIVPWNFPLQTLVWKVAAALATGCCVVIKPSEVTPLTALYFAQLTTEAGFPDGVVNVVNGTGANAGSALVAHKDIAKVTFTGSTPAGKQVGKSALNTVKHITLELGGKSPIVVCADSNIEVVVDTIVNGAFFNSGQVCDAGSRVIIAEEIYDEVVSKLTKRVHELQISPGLDEACFLGPLTSQVHKSKVLSFIQQAKETGLSILVDRSQEVPQGFFVGPVIIADCPTDNPLWTEEVFGPVLVIKKAKDQDEMIALANDTEYGLGATIMSENQNTILKLSKKIKAGTIYVNGHGFLDPALPFGGLGQSGFGKDMGVEQIDSYLETKSVIFQMGTSNP